MMKYWKQQKIEKSGIPRVSCSGAHGYGGSQAVKAAKIVKENTSLELLINVGSDLNKETILKLKNMIPTLFVVIWKL